jgi:hypothetical protein
MIQQGFPHKPMLNYLTNLGWLQRCSTSCWGYHQGQEW